VCLDELTFSKGNQAHWYKSATGRSGYRTYGITEYVCRLRVWLYSLGKGEARNCIESRKVVHVPRNRTGALKLTLLWTVDQDISWVSVLVPWRIWYMISMFSVFYLGLSYTYYYR